MDVETLAKLSARENNGHHNGNKMRASGNKTYDSEN